MSAALASHAILIAETAGLLRGSRDWTANIDDLLQRVGEGLAVSRVYLFQVHEVPDLGLGQTCRYDWAMPGLAVMSTEERKFTERILEADAVMASWAERRRRGELIEGHRRDVTGLLRQDFDRHAIVSFVSMPIMVNGQWWGHLGFAECERERDWTDAEKAVLRTVVYLLGDAIELSTSSLIMSEATRVAMLQTAPDGIVVADESGAVLEFNPAAEAIFGWKRSKIIGRPVSSVLVPQPLKGAFAYLLRKLQRGQAGRFLGHHTETLGLHAKEHQVPLELAVTEIKQGGRRLFVAYLRDLTERKKTEAEVARQREALHQSEKLTALGSLLAGVAHELNNPLSVVIGRAVMLEEDSKDPVQRERLRKLREAAERCAKVSKTFLAMARQTPAVRAPMSMNKAIQSALDLVAYPFRSSGVSVRLELDEALPKAVADFDQIVQVFVNLFVNAEHAMRETDGQRILTVTTRGSSDGKAAIGEVADSGPGIKSDVLPRIFDPFFTTKAIGLGTGMGLSVSFGMVAAHGGSIEAVPPPGGVGACFRVTLPVGRATAVEAVAQLAAPPKPPRRKVLIVDDEPEVADLLCEVLQRAGHLTEHVSDGRQALTLLTTEPYDAVFCDLRMPVLDGRGLRRTLLETHPIYERRMAYVTGDLLSSDAAGGTLDGCPLIEKPFQVRAILDTLARLIEAV